MRTHAKILLYTFTLFLITKTSNAQLFKKKSENKFECGYVYKKSLKEKLNVTSLIGKAVGSLIKQKASKFEFDKTAVSFIRGNHIYPLGYVDMPFKFENWETCGTSISTFALSKTGLPLIEIPKFTIDGEAYDPIGFGQYSAFFDHTDTSNKQVVIEDNNGTKIAVDLKPMEGFTIKSVNGVPRWDTSLTFDGSEDMIIELNNTVDPEAHLGVELHNKVTGVRFNSPVFFTVDKNTITIPKEAFRNAMKFIENNMLIVYKYKENLLDNKAIGNGAMRIVDVHYDFTPITIEGDMAKSIFSKMWKSENQKVENKDLSKETKYDFEFKKGDPLYYHPSSEIKKIAIPSFVVRGNLSHTHQDVTTTTTKSVSYTSTHKITSTYTSTTIKTLTKWFPELNKETWQLLANRLYVDFAQTLKNEYEVPIVDVKKITAAASYKKIIPILDTVTKSFVEVGAFNTQRVLPSIKKERQTLRTTGGRSTESAKGVDKGGEITIPINTFPSDFVSSRIMKEFDANCAVTVNFDLEFDIQAEALLPVVSIKFYAPTMGYNAGMNYFHEIQAYYKESIPLKEVSKSGGTAVDQIYNMIDASQFFKELKYTLDQILDTETKNDVYQKIWDAMY